MIHHRNGLMDEGIRRREGYTENDERKRYVKKQRKNEREREGRGVEWN